MKRKFTTATRIFTLCFDFLDLNAIPRMKYNLGFFQVVYVPFYFFCYCNLGWFFLCVKKAFLNASQTRKRKARTRRHLVEFFQLLQLNTNVTETSEFQENARYSSAILSDLFHKAIMMSGSAFSDWAMVEDPVHYAVKLASGLNCSIPR